MSDHPTITYATALLLTLAIETPIVAAGLRRWYRVPAAHGVAIGTVASLVTHPIVWFVLPDWFVPRFGSLGYLLVAEGLAWLAEATMIWLTTRRDLVRPLLLSLLANLASFTVGALLSTLGLL